MSSEFHPAAIQTSISMAPQGGGGRLACKVYGCKRSYTSVEALNSHINDHLIPAESLPGKFFLCSAVGCHGSFNSMQELMEHMRVHYKPNVFFVCESCRAKLRSHRTLLKHLQTCAKVGKSKVARGGGVPSEQAIESDPQGLTSGAVEPPEASEPEQMETETTPPATEPPVATQQSPDPSCMPSSCSPAEGPYQSPQLSPSVQSLSSSPQSSVGSGNAVWRKNQGQSFNSRILWEHTKGRYNCLQCGHSTPNRKEMTTHIEGQHKSLPGKSPSDTDTGECSPSHLQSSSDAELIGDTPP